jgi:hypothetical protein
MRVDDITILFTFPIGKERKKEENEVDTYNFEKTGVLKFVLLI